MTAPDESTTGGARAAERLRTDRIGWLTTLDPDGQPQSSPIWFLWQEETIVVYSGKRARRNANLEDHRLVAFNLNSDEGGGDIVSAEGVAEIDPDGPPATDNPAYLEKYQALLHAYGWTPDYFAGEYPVVVRIRPSRWRFG